MSELKVKKLKPSLKPNSLRPSYNKNGEEIRQSRIIRASTRYDENNKAEIPANEYSQAPNSNSAINNSMNKKRAYCPIPKNINEFQHLFANGGGSKKEIIRWMIGLRSIDKFPDPEHMREPSFFSQDQENFRQKQAKNPSDEFKFKGNLGTYDHLAVHRIGERPSPTQLKFETNLRGYKFIESSQSREKKNKSGLQANRSMINLSPKIKRDNFEGFLPALIPSSINNLSHIEPVSRELEVKVSKIHFLDHEQYQRSYVKSNRTSIVGNDLGVKYNNRYGERNINVFVHLLDNLKVGENFNLRWATKLRSSN